MASEREQLDAALAVLAAFVERYPLRGLYGHRSKRCDVCKSRSPVVAPEAVHRPGCPLHAAIDLLALVADIREVPREIALEELTEQVLDSMPLPTRTAKVDALTKGKMTDAQD